MELSVSEQDGVLVHKLAGELDALSVREIRSELEAQLDTESDWHLLSLAEVPMIDSTGIGLLMYLYKRLKERGRRMALIGVSGQPEELLRFLHINKVFPCYADFSEFQRAELGS